MNSTAKFLAIVQGILRRIVNEEGDRIEEASRLMADSLARGGLLYVFGTGHSMLIAFEAFYRAGGLVPVYPIIDLSLLGAVSATRSTLLERLNGYGEALVESIGPIKGSSIIVVSNSGTNAAPVEVAIACKRRELSTIAITSVEYSQKLKARNKYRKKLYEVVDVAIDNKVPEGDAAYKVGGKVLMGPISTIVNSFIVHALSIRTAELLMDKGIEPEVWSSSNVPGGIERNKAYITKYANLIKGL